MKTYYSFKNQVARVWESDTGTGNLLGMMKIFIILV